MHGESHITVSSRATPTPRIETADVVIVGARCAGAATAMLLARAGHDVVMVDRALFPSDTLSTHAIARGGVVQLHRWGLLDAVVASGAPPIRRVEFCTGDQPVVRTVKDRHGVDFLVAPRRHVLDPLIQGAAVDAGARLRPGVTVTGVVRNAAGRVIGITGRDGIGPIEVHARFVIGADGLKSRVARSVGARMLERRDSGGATHYAYFAGHWPAMEYHLGDGSFAGVFPTHSGEACVWVCAPDDWALRPSPWALDDRRRVPGNGQGDVSVAGLTARRRRGHLDGARDDEHPQPDRRTDRRWVGTRWRCRLPP